MIQQHKANMPQHKIGSPLLISGSTEKLSRLLEFVFGSNLFFDAFLLDSTVSNPCAIKGCTPTSGENRTEAEKAGAIFKSYFFV